jgi:peptide/nickel transport system permease protein
MVIFLLRRVLHSVPVLVGVIVLSFVIIHLAPGDPVQLMLGVHATPSAVAAARHNLGLDHSLAHQLFSFFVNALQGDFGTSIISQAPVNQIVEPRVLPTVYLILYSVVLALVLAVPLAMISAVRQHGPADQVIRLLGMVVFAMPSFWIGLMIVLLVGLKLGWLPVSGYSGGPVGLARTLTLPAVTLALYLAPMMVRTLRASLVEALATEYVEAARARGLSELRVIGEHALRNSLIPLITVLSINIGFLISGTVIVENVFQIPGLGSLLVQSVLQRDFPIIQALVFVFGVMVIVTNLAADLAYVAVDPRVREGRSS